MFFKYLLRELSKRKKQTSLIASGLAVAIALVVVVNSVSGGIKSAQAEALSGLYGIGTDISVSKEATPGEPGQRFEVGSGDGSTQGQTRTFSKSRLETSRASGAITADELAAITSVDGITASVATLKLNSVTFNGSCQLSLGNRRRHSQERILQRVCLKLAQSHQPVGQTELEAQPLM